MNETLPIIEPELTGLSLSTAAIWFILAVAVVVIATIVSIIWFVRKKSAFRRKALQELALVNANQNDAFTRINTILKWTALQSFPRTEVAPLYGDAWFGWMNSRTKKKPFSKNLIQEVNARLYSHSTDDWARVLEQFKSASAEFIRHHGV
jgi:hypothetical protein